uniref:Potassium channel tetramerization domain containing 10 n=1 Tax=Terrapene triunguis TaxID=2587831 RepID=A0A674JKZ3_9SAUR
MEEMSGDSVVSSAVPAAATRTTSFKGTSPSSKYVKLNIGGALYYTTMQTLTKQDTMLKAMFSGRMEVLTDSEGKETLFTSLIFPCHESLTLQSRLISTLENGQL